MESRNTHRQGWKRPRRHTLLIAAVPVVVLVLAGMVSAAPPGTANLKIAKADSPDPVSVGSNLTYAVMVENLGPTTATGVTVTDQLPKGVDLVSATASTGKCAPQGSKVTCDLGTIGTVQTVNYLGPATVTIVVIPRQPGTIKNTATVKSDQKDPVAANNKASATTRVIAAAKAATCRGVTATIVGTPGNDTLAGTGGPDVIAALGGSDTVASSAGRDLICAGAGNDYVGAGSAADRVLGGAGKDRLLGRGGSDVLKGNGGSDVLKGNRGGDRLRGGRGIDRCRGGAGADSIRGCER
jgi:uncharacterized repeat protein (TIGR01451 family)